MSSSAAPSSLSRILLGSLIGAAIGLVLLALGVAILWNAADQRLGEASPSTPPPVAATPKPSGEKAASSVPYPVVAPEGSTPPVEVAPEAPPAATSIWRSIFDDDEDDQTAPAAPAVSLPEVPRAAPTAPRSVPRPVTPRPSTPRRPPEAQRQDDSLFF